jgi:hydrogenase 3 maturation protease
MCMDREILESLARWRDSAVVILGVGNVLKGDDAAGPLVCERLSGRLSATVIDAGPAPENYVRPILRKEPDALLIVDAVDFGGPPGQIRLFEPEQIRKFAFSTHALSLHLFIDLLRGNSITPEKKGFAVYLIGLQVCHTDLGAPVSPAVERSVRRLADAFIDLFAR